ncbi:MULTISPECIES: RICIN domain-containing protein [unclassified Streptomyces]|uniref:RICIN domain-containing protein n=1 Tax=unclassified Streptomyces TaxID=2593676 RepID=UPI003790645A
MIEMLAQSRPGRVELLPALPQAWAASGSVTGVGLRGGFTLDMSWKSGQVTSATLRGAAGRSTTVVFGAWSQAVTIPSALSVTVEPPAQHTVFQLVNRRSGRAVDVPRASTTQGTGLTQYTPGSAVNQQFRFIPVGGGSYEIRTTHGTTPLAWDISGGDATEGAQLVQWSATHATNQQWKITETGDGHVTIACARSGKVLGVTADSTANGATIEQQTPNGGTGQQWRRIGK